MQMKVKGPGAGWRWLVSAVNLGRHNAGALFGAAAMLMGLALLPSVLQVLFAELAGPGNVTAAMAVSAIVMLVFIVVFPLLMGGFLRIIHATETGQPTRAMALFDVFRDQGMRGRVIGIGLLLLLVYLVLLALVLGLAGRGVVAWYVELISLAQGATPGSTPALPEMPEGMGRVMALMMLVAMFTGGIYSIGFGQVVLNGRRVGEAFSDALVGTLKNVLPLLVLTVLGLVGMLVAALAIGLAVAFLVVLGSLDSPVLGMLLAVPVYAAFLLAIYVVMFGVMYFIWRDVCGDAIASDPGAPMAGIEA